MEIFTDTKFDFMSRRYLSLGFSVLLLAASFGGIFIKGFNFGIDFQGGTEVEFKFAEAPDIGALRAQLSSLPVGSWLLGLTNALIGLLGNSVLVLVFLVFLLAGSGGANALSPVWRQIASRVERYLITKIALSGITGVLVTVILWLLGVELAVMFGFLAFLLNFIPSIDSIVATLLPLPILLVNPDVSWTTVALAIALPGGVQFAVGSVMEPRIMGDSLQLHPIAILLALIFWGALWGIVGMLLATPMTAVIKILLERSELTQPVSRLLEGRLTG